MADKHVNDALMEVLTNKIDEWNSLELDEWFSRLRDIINKYLSEKKEKISGVNDEVKVCEWESAIQTDCTDADCLLSALRKKDWGLERNKVNVEGDTEDEAFDSWITSLRKETEILTLCSNRNRFCGLLNDLPLRMKIILWEFKLSPLTETHGSLDNLHDRLILEIKKQAVELGVDFTDLGIDENGPVDKTLEVREVFIGQIVECADRMEEIELTGVYARVRDDITSYCTNTIELLNHARSEAFLYDYMAEVVCDLKKSVELLGEVISKEDDSVDNMPKIDMNMDMSREELSAHVEAFFSDVKKNTTNKFGKTILFTTLAMYSIKLKELLPDEMDLDVFEEALPSFSGLSNSLEKLIKELKL